MLSIDSPPYEYSLYSGHRGGLGVVVEEGGELRMTGRPGLPAGLAPVDPQYPFTLDVAGRFISHGLPETPNLITGLAGRHQGVLLLSGFRMTGEANVTHTEFKDNRGPALFVHQGGSLQGHNLTFIGRGTFGASNAAEIVLRDLSVDGEDVAVAFTQTPRVSIEGCDLTAAVTGVIVMETGLEMRDCRVSAPNGVLAQRGAVVMIEDTSIEYDHVGITSVPDSGGRTKPGWQNDIRLLRVSVFPGTEQAQSAFLGVDSNVTISDSDLESRNDAAIPLAGSSLDIRRSRLHGTPAAIWTRDPTRLRVEETTSHEGPVAHVERTLSLVITDSSVPVAGANVSIPEAFAYTDENGTAGLRWTWFEADQVEALEWPEVLGIQIARADGSSLAIDVEGDSTRARLELADLDGSGAPTATERLLPLGGLIAVGAFLLMAWIRRRRG